MTYTEQVPHSSAEGITVPHYGYRHVMMAVDNSAHSNQAVEVGLAIARVFGAKITGSHAYAARLHDLRFKQMEGGLPEQYRRESELEKQRDTHDTLITHGLEIITDSYLDVVDDKAAEAGLRLRRRSVEGKNYRALLDDIQGSDYDLVVLGALGLGAVRSSTVGSVCERIVRRADRDVLVVKDPKRGIDGGPIMVAVDGSSRSYAGLKTAFSLGARFGANVEVVSAFDPYFHYVAFHSIAGVLSEEAGEVFRFKEQEQLHEDIIDSGLAKIYQTHLAVSEKIAAEDGAVIATKLLAGKPYEVILRHIRKRNPSLLVIGRTGVHADSGLDIGSNAENLLRLAPCHVLMIEREYTPRPELIAEETTVWTDEAEKRMAGVPDHVRGMARMAIIRYAQDHGHTVISTNIVDEAVENLLPADAMAAMGMLTKVARNRRLENGDRLSAAESAFDDREIHWSQDAERCLASIEDEMVRGHIRLRVEKLARSEKRTTVSEELVHRLTDELRPRWTEEALQLLQRIPEHIRPMARQMMELYAEQEGITTIDHELMRDIRNSFESRYGEMARCPFRDGLPAGVDAGDPSD